MRRSFADAVFGVIVTPSVAWPPAGTTTLGALNVADAKFVTSPGANVFAVVPTAGWCATSYVTADDPPLWMVSVCTCGPVPSPRASLPGLTLAAARIASSIWSVPAPCRCAEVTNALFGGGRFDGTALFWRISRSRSGFVVPCSSKKSAAAPVTCGAAIDVPLMVATPPASRGQVLLMRPPGAAMSGLNPSDGARPQEVNDDGCPAVAFAKTPLSSVQLSVCDSASIALLIAAPSVSEMATTGMVTGWPSALAPGCTATVAPKRPGTLLYSTTAAAPASCARRAFS